MQTDFTVWIGLLKTFQADLTVWINLPTTFQADLTVWIDLPTNFRAALQDHIMIEFVFEILDLTCIADLQTSSPTKLPNSLSLVAGPH